MKTFENILSSDIMQALGWSVLHSVWQGPAIALVVLLLVAVCKPATAHVKYLLYASGLLAMLFCLGLSFVHTYSWLEAIPGPVPPDTQVGLQLLWQPAQAYPEVALPLHARASLVLQENVGMITLCWLLGALLFLFRLFGGLFYAQSMLRHGTQEVSGEWEQRLQSMAARLGIRKSIRLLTSVLAGTPMVIGHLKPVILLPAGLLTGLSAAQVEAMLAHELAHIRRSDWLVNLLQSVVETLFFFHPVAWWLSSKIREEREKCCDDLAVEITGDAFAYVKTLSAIQEVKQGIPAMAMAFGKKKYLLERIKRLVSADHEEKTFSARLILLFLTLLGITAFAFIIGQNEGNRDPEVLQSEMPPVITGGETRAMYQADQDTIPGKGDEQQAAEDPEKGRGDKEQDDKSNERPDSGWTDNDWEDSDWKEDTTARKGLYWHSFPVPVLPPELDSLLFDLPPAPEMYGSFNFDDHFFDHLPFEFLDHGDIFRDFGLQFTDTLMMDSLPGAWNDSTFDAIREELLEARRQSRKAREEYRDKINEYRQELMEHQHKLRNLQDSYQQELREYQERIREEQEEQRDHQLRLRDKQMQAMKETRKEQWHRMEEMREKQLKNDKFMEELRSQLEADRLISEGGPIDFSYDADKNEMKVNGKSLNKKQKEQYKALLKEYHHLPESGSFRYQNN